MATFSAIYSNCEAFYKKLHNLSKQLTNIQVLNQQSNNSNFMMSNYLITYPTITIY